MSDASVPARPTVTVVMPTFDRRAVVCDAIESVRAQSLVAFELLVVDDGSVDGTAAMVSERYADDARVVVVPTPHAGVSLARNVGLERARGTYVSFLDSDDLMLPDCLASQVAFIEAQPDADMVHCDAFLEDPRGDTRRLFASESFRAPTSLASMFEGGWGLVHGMLLRTEVARALGFRPEYHVAEDTDFQFRFFIAGHRAVLNPEPLVVYREHDGIGCAAQLSRDDVERAKARLRMMREHRPHAPDLDAYVGTERYLCRRIAKALAAEGRYREARPYVLTWLRQRPFRPRLIAWLVAGCFQRSEAPAP